jgi:hypothetical protein
MDGASLYTVADEKLRQTSVQVVFESRSEAIVLGLDSGTVLLSETLATSFDGMPVQTSAE